LNYYLIYAFFKTNQIDSISIERAKHLAYIEQNIKFMHYGGLIKEDTNLPKGVMYVICASDLIAATTFLKADPYFKLFQTYNIELFEQKIPKIK
jgi:uncharacterized protein YciI